MNKEDAIDHCKWRKMIKDVRWSACVWVGECFFWYRSTRVVPYQRPLNGCVCVCYFGCWLARTTHTTLGDRSFAVAGPHVWNSLPATVRQITGYGWFRQHVKTHLFRASESQRIVTLDYCVLCKYSYLHLHVKCACTCMIITVPHHIFIVHSVTIVAALLGHVHRCTAQHIGVDFTRNIWVPYKHWKQKRTATRESLENWSRNWDVTSWFPVQLKEDRGNWMS